MCYRCATNPSIHHHRCHIVAVSSLLSHHGVTFAVALSWFHHCHGGVTFASVAVLLLPSQCHLYCRIIMVSSSQLHCCGAGFVVAVTVSPSLSHCHGFVVAVAMSPSCWLWFHHCHHGVAFVVASSWCHRCSHIVMVPSLSHCRGFVITIVVSPSSSHHHSFIVAVSLLQSCHCGAFAVTSLQFYCHHRCYHHRLALHLDAKREEPKIPEKPKILSGL